MLNEENHLKESEGKMIFNNLLRIAALPKGNPDSIEYTQYTLPLLEHDYPALTSAMWNAAYREFGIDVGNIMVIGNPADCQQILALLKDDPKYLGGGAGVGFKDVANQYVDELDPLAEAIGSINLVIKTEEGKLKGFNTDGLGFAKGLEDILLKKGETLSGQKGVILGAGGTSNSIVFALIEKGMELVILNRTVSKAEALAKRANSYFKREVCRFGSEEDITVECEQVRVIVNVSTKGAAGEFQDYSALAKVTMPVNDQSLTKNIQDSKNVLASFSKDKIICDVVLRGGVATPTLKLAIEAGFDVLDGVPMVINQGVLAFEIIHQKELSQKGITREQITMVMNRAAQEAKN
jgi:shikimate dehydrogenase